MHGSTIYPYEKNYKKQKDDACISLTVHIFADDIDNIVNDKSGFMEEIRIYHSIWKNIGLIAICFVFVAMGIQMLLRGEQSFIAWTCILFFGGGGLFVLFLILREIISHKAYYIITDESVSMDSGMKKWEVRFADVEEFYLINVSSSKQIGIKYKKEVEFQKMNDASSVGRTFRKLNERLAGVQESLPADGLNIKPQELCDLLNMRLTR